VAIIVGCDSSEDTARVRRRSRERRGVLKEKALQEKKGTFAIREMSVFIDHQRDSHLFVIIADRPLLPLFGHDPEGERRKERRKNLWSCCAFGRRVDDPFLIRFLWLCCGDHRGMWFI